MTCLKYLFFVLLLPFFFGCESKSVPPNIIDEIPIGTGLDSDVTPVVQIEDGAVNGYVLISDAGYDENPDGSETSFYSTYETSADMIIEDGFSENLVNQGIAHCANSTYDLDENGRVQRHSGYCYNVWRSNYTVENGLIKGVDDTIYIHSDKGILTAIENPYFESRFTHNTSGQITRSEYIWRNPNGVIIREEYRNHIYDELEQRIQTTFNSLTNDGLPQRTRTTEYFYDSNRNNTKAIVTDEFGNIKGETTFEYAVSERPVVNLRLRSLLYFNI